MIKHNKMNKTAHFLAKLIIFQLKWIIIKKINHIKIFQNLFLIKKLIYEKGNFLFYHLILEFLLIYKNQDKF